MLFHYNNGCTNAPQCYVICTLSVLFYLQIPLTLVLSNPHLSPGDLFQEQVTIKMLHTAIRAVCPAQSHLSLYNDSQHSVHQNIPCIQLPVTLFYSVQLLPPVFSSSCPQILFFLQNSSRSFHIHMTKILFVNDFCIGQRTS